MRIAQAGQSVIVVDAEDRISTQISARNSEVIHAGIYYQTDWLKTQLCIAGKRMLYRFCKDNGVSHRNCGKFIVATSHDQITKLEALACQAQTNGVEGCHLLEGNEARELEPELRCVAALHSTSSGIVCTHELAYALAAQFENSGGVISCNTRFDRARRKGDKWEITFRDIADFTMGCRNLINCAGLEAQAVANAIEGVDPSTIPALYLAKGNYFSAGQSPFSRLIYPLPQEGGLGVHATLDLGGGLRFGPDVEWVDKIDYEVNGSRIDDFLPAIETYWPGVAKRTLRPDQSGIRPKLYGPGEPAKDFDIRVGGGGSDPRIVNLFGIESPGITSSLAIGGYVANCLGLEAHPA